MQHGPVNTFVGPEKGVEQDLRDGHSGRVGHTVNCANG